MDLLDSIMTTMNKENPKGGSSTNKSTQKPKTIAHRKSPAGATSSAQRKSPTDASSSSQRKSNVDSISSSLHKSAIKETSSGHRNVSAESTSSIRRKSPNQSKQEIEEKPSSSQTGGQKPPSVFSRIPKKPRTMDTNNEVPSPRPPPVFNKRPISSSDHYTQDVKRDKIVATFKTINTVPIQTNQFLLNLDGIPEIIERYHVDIFAVNEKKKTIQINGENIVHGDLAKQYRHWGLWNVWKHAINCNPQYFKPGTKYYDGAYDCGSSIYFPAGYYEGKEDEVILNVNRDNIEPLKWAPIRLMLKSEIVSLSFVIVRNKHDSGRIYTRGPKAFSGGNCGELVRFLEVLTSQVISGRDYFNFGNSTFNRSSDKLNGEVERACQFDSEGKEIRTGFEKTMRVVSSVESIPKIVMTIDTRRSPFYQEQPVLNMLKVLYSGGNGRNGNNRERYDDRSNLDREILNIIEIMRRDGESRTNKKLSELKSFAVKPTHLSQNKINLFYITSFLYQSAHEFKFAKDGDDNNQISMFDYFIEKYHYTIKYPELPLAVQKRGNFISCTPFELLTIERGQRVKQNNITTRIQQEMTGKLSLLPRQHIEKSRAVLENHLKINQNKFLNAFGLKISSEPTSLVAKVLPAPDVHFAYKSVEQPQTGIQKRPRIEAKRAKFIRPAQLNEIWIICFEEVFPREMLVKMNRSIDETCRNQGIKIAKKPEDWPIHDVIESDHLQLQNIMKDAKQKNVSLVFAVTREQRPDVHDFLKLYESQTGVQTQHISAKTARMIMSPSGRQTTDNVIRKLNLKCGGLNFSVSIPRTVNSRPLWENERGVKPVFFENTMFIGFEISHAGATCLFDKQNNILTGEPSVVGYSYSFGDCCDLGGSSYLQKPREHSLMYLPKYMSEILQIYINARKTLPERVVVYRSGVGEGDFLKIKEEVRLMKSVFETDVRLRGKRIPQFIMIVVSRISHMRIYPKEVTGGNSFEQNVPSGTCVAGGITTYESEEFYLISQSALIGTIRPARYTILVNDPKWSVNEVSHLTYFLAFGHQVSYQPAGIPNVLYAAENLAKRGRNNWKAHQKTMRLDASDSRGRSTSSDDDDIDSKMESLTSKLNKCKISCKNFWA